MPWRIEDPQGFVVSTECRKAAEDNGFRLKEGERDGWVQFRSTTVPGRIWLAGAGDHGPWYVALDHAGVARELGWRQHEGCPGMACERFETTAELHQAVSRIYDLARSLPEHPLEEFRKCTRDLPQRTEAERTVIQRVGQDVFRDALMRYWQGRCPLTGISDAPLLRASHIRPWKDCETDAQRLDVFNGLLLSSLWDAAFDAGLVTFDDTGEPLFSSHLTDAARQALQWQQPLPLRDEHRQYLTWHQQHVFRQ